MTSALNNWLIFLLASGPTIALILLLIVSHRERLRWMRIFCAKLEIPPTTMESEPPKTVTVPVPRERRHITVPVPGVPAGWPGRNGR
jgi:hypothetical protein